MTTKQGARAARDHLYVAKQRAASATAATQKRTFEQRQRALQQKARAARALATQPNQGASASCNGGADAAAASAPSTGDDTAATKTK